MLWQYIHLEYLGGQFRFVLKPRVSAHGHTCQFCKTINWPCSISWMQTCRVFLSIPSIPSKVLFRPNISHPIITPTVHLSQGKCMGTTLSKQRLALWVMDVITVVYIYVGWMPAPSPFDYFSLGVTVHFLTLPLPVAWTPNKCQGSLSFGKQCLQDKSLMRRFQEKMGVWQWHLLQILLYVIGQFVPLLKALGMLSMMISKLLTPLLMVIWHS